jgi:protease IV
MSENTEKKEKLPTQSVVLKPKLKGFFIVYLLTSLPQIFMSFIGLPIFLILIFSLIGAISSVNSSVDSDINRELRLESYDKIGSNKDNKKILIYDLEGAIQSGGNGVNVPADGIYTDIIKRDFKKIKNDSSIENVVFRFNSPGGEVFASQELGDDIKDLLDYKNIDKGVFYFDQLAASGALIATYKNDNYVFASEYGETGSIGVIQTLYNLEGLADKVGIREVTIKSGQSKDFGSPFRDLTDSEQNYLQGQVDNVYGQFINIVSKGRNIETEKVRQIANGFVYFNSEAKNYNLIDEIGDLNSAVDKAAKDKGIDSYEVYRMDRKGSIFDQIFVKASSALAGNIGLNSQNLQTVSRLGSLKPGTLYALDINKF